jgi:hypothetical protein
MFSKIYQAIFGPMPLNDFKDYDDYWTQRTGNSPSQTVLHRFISIADRIPDGATVVDIG